MSAKTIALWNISLSCRCPECKSDVDLLDEADFWDGRELDIGEHGTKRSKNQKVYCPKCYSDFEVCCEY
jgi:predicted Zn-ribbon and HTH transcriptional regulator